MFTPTYANSEENIENTSKYLARFNNYLQYHIACSKGLLDTIVTDRISLKFKNINESFSKNRN